MKKIKTFSAIFFALCLYIVPISVWGESWVSPYPEKSYVDVSTSGGSVENVREVVQGISVSPSEPAEEETEAEEEGIPDPLEPVNRAFFKFNDRLYFWVLKPAASGYKTIVPEDARIGVRNFFSNLTTPVRFVNCLLQADFRGGGMETIRFAINSTFGLAGFLDTARKEFHIEKRDKDFGQTLGVYGMQPVFYLNWPILGPSSLRDTIGYLGDLALDPRTYVSGEPWIYMVWAARAAEVVNETSLVIGEYEGLKKAALDPYVAVREAYLQYRQHKIKER